MNHPTLQPQAELSLIPAERLWVVRSLRDEILSDDIADMREMRYPAYFMAHLSFLQRQQVIKFIEAIPLRDSATATFRPAPRKMLFFTVQPAPRPAKRTMQWIEEQQYFVASTEIPQS